ncbi:DUF1611 domain-containing protein [Kordiimonas aquimaris]|uniref:DUF1611 domain-containing protein n=1 Tax=Kordiimonas aquimaris TaxID=707591 RepID=UPI0021D005B8|nr:DUF1611 domain-containing protein [Kordiimonas aquimaris]
MNRIEIKPPYLIFLGNETELTYAKTGAGLVEWRPELCKGQIRLEGGTIDLGIPDMTLDQAVTAGIKSLIVGTASVGGAIPDQWISLLEQAINKGMDIVAGVHSKLNDHLLLKQAADTSGSKLIDVRVPPPNLPVGTGVKRTGKRLLTVGTDCALGKKYTALAIERELKAASTSINATFRASGQTGIMIAGEGIPIDCVVADFISGAAELLSPNNKEDHWDIIEGQGSIFHPGYSAVSMGLLIGSQPDAFVVCTEAGRTHIEGWPEFKLPSIEEVIERTIQIGSQVNPDIKCVGISVNTSTIPDTQRQTYIEELSKRTGFPCFDPMIDGTSRIINNMMEQS